MMQKFCHECTNKAHFFWKSNCLKQNIWNVLSLWKHIKKLKASQYIFGDKGGRKYLEDICTMKDCSVEYTILNFFLGTIYLLYTSTHHKFKVVRPPFKCFPKKLHKIFAKIYETKYIHIYYEIHYEIWAVLHHREGKIVFRSKMSMKWIFGFKE